MKPILGGETHLSILMVFRDFGNLFLRHAPSGHLGLEEVAEALHTLIPGRYCRGLLGSDRTPVTNVVRLHCLPICRDEHDLN